MKKYIVCLNVIKVDSNKNNVGQEYIYEFASENLIKDRKKAIKKAKAILANVDSFLSEGEVFSRYFQAHLNGFKNFNCFSLTIELVTNDGEWEDNTPIYGADEHEKIDWLESEAHVFIASGLDVKFTQTENGDGDLVEVLLNDLDFLLS